MIGILSCPGGKHFADSIVTHLVTIFNQKHREKIDVLSEKYGLSKDELHARLNLYQDILPVRFRSAGITPQQQKSNINIPAKFTKFANGEFKTEILTTVRDYNIYIVQDVENHHPLKFNGCEEPQTLSVNDNIMCLLTTVDAALQADAKRVTVVIPTYPYSRQHQKKGREGLAASRIGQILEYFGVSRIITLDIHSKEIENSFNHLRLENLHASYQMLKVLSSVIDLKDENLIIVSPDTGSVLRNKFYSSTLKRPLGMIYKERDYSRTSRSANKNNITKMKLLGNVKNKNVFMCDDMLGTGGTLLKAMSLLKKRGANKIVAAVSLPFFSGSAIDVFDQAYRDNLFYRVIGTNAVYHSEKTLMRKEWYLSADVSNLFAKSIYRLHYNRSLSSLLDNRDMINELLRKN